MELEEHVRPPETIANDLAEAFFADQQAANTNGSESDEDEDLQRAIRESLETVGSNVQPLSTLSTQRTTSAQTSSEEITHTLAAFRDQEPNDMASLLPSGRRIQRKASRMESSNTNMNAYPSKSRRRSRYRSSPASTSLDDDLSFYSMNTHSSPFLHPVASSSMEGMEEDVSELDEDESEVDDESTGPADIDDEQMQAVIAASLGHEYTISKRVLDRTDRAFRLGSSGHMDKAEQVPADVERIRRLRASRSKEEQTPESDGQASAPLPDSSAPEQMGDEEEDEKPVNPTPEEMRRLRLARFG